VISVRQWIAIYEVRYCRDVPRELSAGRVLVHNGVRPVARRCGRRGSRFWTQIESSNLERCDCGWAPELAEHYRVAFGVIS